MKKKALALVLCISMAAVMFTGCKTVVQNPTGTTPQVISPEVTIQQESKEEPNVINVSGSGEIKLVPDIATVSIQVRTYNEKPAAAQFYGSFSLRNTAGKHRRDGCRTRSRSAGQRFTAPTFPDSHFYCVLI